MKNERNKKDLWFKRKRYGWGWTPINLKGWMSVLLYTVFIVLIFRRIDSYSHSVSDTLYGIFIPFILLTILLIVLCYLKGESPKWQWGNKKSLNTS